MFDSLKGMAGLAGLMKDMPRIKAKVEEVKERLATIEVDAETGGGAVRVTASAQLKILGVHIDHAMFAALAGGDSPDDRAMAEDLITGAVNAALEKARQAAEKEMGDAAQELGLPIPPGGLGGLMA